MKKVLVCIYLLGGVLTAQTVLVKGKITTANEPVKNAKVVLINASDTTKKYESLSDAEGNYSIGIITTVKEEKNQLPTKFELAQNYPNPFSDETIISYKMNEPEYVDIKIYNILGQQVRTFKGYMQSKGVHAVTWDGKNDYGARISPGVYFYRIQVGNETGIKKMLFGIGKILSNASSLNSVPFKVNAQLYTKNLLPTEITFTIRILNTSNTLPRISKREFYNVLINQDTTLQLYVNKETHYNLNLFVGNWGYDQLYVIDADKDEVIDTISGFKNLGNITPTRSGRKLYVTTSSSSVYPYDIVYPASVFAVDLATKTKKEILNRRAIICSTPSGVPIIVASISNQNTNIEKDTMRVIGAVDTISDAISFYDTLNILHANLPMASPETFIVNPHEPFLYTFNNQRRLFSYNYEEKKIIKDYRSIHIPYNMFISPDGKNIYCANGPIVNLSDDMIVGQIQGNNENILGTVALNPNGKILYLTDPGGFLLPEPMPSGHINTFNVNGKEEIIYSGFIDVNKASRQAYTITDRMAITPDGKKAFVTDGGSKIFVLDLETNQVVNTIKFIPRNISVRTLVLSTK